MIIFAFGSTLPYTKDLPVVKQIKCKTKKTKKNCDAAKNLACEYYGDNNLKKRGLQNLLILKVLQETIM